MLLLIFFYCYEDLEFIIYGGYILLFLSLSQAIVLHIFILFVILPSESTLLILPFLCC